jgi:hypothetical protein
MFFQNSWNRKPRDKVIDWMTNQNRPAGELNVRREVMGKTSAIAPGAASASERITTTRWRS